MVTTSVKTASKDFQHFLELGKSIPQKNEMTVMSCIQKVGNRITVTSFKEWLSSGYDGQEADGLYNFADTTAFQILRLSAIDSLKFPELGFNPSVIPGSRTVDNLQARSMLAAFGCVSDDETRYFINGICFSQGRVVSTDGRRMYVGPGFEDFPGVILPETATLRAMLKKGEYIEYGVIGAYSVFNFLYKETEFQYCVRNIEGQFPNWSMIVEKAQTFNSMGVPDLEGWKVIAACSKKLCKGKKHSRVLIQAHEGDADIVDIYHEETLIDSLIWPGFGNNTLDEKLLAINAEYLDDALFLDGLKGIRYGTLDRAITFDSLDGTMVIVMPMQID